MKNFYRWPQLFDIDAIKAEIEKNDDWLVNTNRQNTIYVQRKTQTITLIDGAPLKGEDIRDCDGTQPTKFFERYPQALRALAWFVTTYGGVMGRASLVKLPASEKVYPHIDEGAYYRARDRFHLVIQGKYQFFTPDEAVIMSEGELWWLDNQQRHWVDNVGETDRIALIFDVKGSSWRSVVKGEST